MEKFLEECLELVKELYFLKQILDNDVKCIDVKMLRNKDQPNKNLKEIEANFQDKIQALKYTKEVTDVNFTITTQTDSMIIISDDRLVMQNKMQEHAR